MHDIEVDQSGRTDVLSTDTILAFSDEIQAAILIPAGIKRQCYHRLKATGLRKRLSRLLFSISGKVRGHTVWHWQPTGEIGRQTDELVWRNFWQYAKNKQSRGRPVVWPSQPGLAPGWIREIAWPPSFV